MSSKSHDRQQFLILPPRLPLLIFASTSN